MELFAKPSDWSANSSSIVGLASRIALNFSGFFHICCLLPNHHLSIASSSISKASRSFGNRALAVNLRRPYFVIFHSEFQSHDCWVPFVRQIHHRKLSCYMFRTGRLIQSISLCRSFGKIGDIHEPKRDW